MSIVKFLEQQYAPRTAVPNSKEYIADFKKRVPQTLFPEKPDVRYGPRPNQLLDIYPAVKDAPTLVWFHGGGWRANSRKNYYHLAQSLSPLIRVIAVGYDLCPYVTIDDITDEAKQAAVWVGENISPEIHLAGHSAGAQMCAMILADGNINKDLVKSTLLLSGMFNLGLHCFMHNDPKITYEQGIRNTPKKPVSNSLIHCMVGAEEPEGFRNETYQYAEMVGCGVTEIPSCNHYHMNKDQLAGFTVDGVHKDSLILKEIKKMTGVLDFL